MLIGSAVCQTPSIFALVVSIMLLFIKMPSAGMLKGAALLGAAGVGLIGDLVETAIERRADTRIVKPDSSQTEKYKEVQKEYVRIYEHMLGFWNKEL